MVQHACIQPDLLRSDDSYHAFLPEIYEAGVGITLQDALDGVASLLCRLLGVPAELARQVPLTVELDQAAVEQLRKPGG
jgi:hypothetical protein